MNATIKKIQAPAKQLWRVLAAHQNKGFFTPCASQQVPAQGDPHVRLPQGLDLRASGPGFDNQPAHLEMASSGETTLYVAGTIVHLGLLSQQRVETGWMITGLRLRGAIRFGQSAVTLMVPDREDVPYLLRALAPQAAAPAQYFRPALAA
ncbi:hypothetical protein [Armatimonas sp.]|uniref:hypothetical protein n=1 Tax=Armatimonas sp. TaxID=1872638 RepID=UPI00374CFC39